jgi:two-component system, OmpR family, phosphate regulon sensor histidine kinase PhoR
VIRNISPRQLVFYISILLPLISFLCIYLLRSAGIGEGWVFYLSVAGISSLSTYIVLYYAIELFIYDRIKVIYKRIYPSQKRREKTDKLDLRKDVVSEINREVMDWVQSNRDEIEQLRKAEVFRREFLANVSHELKTPIFSIQGYIHTLIDGGLDDEHINLLYLEKAAKSLERLCTIVEDLEAISRLESGELILETRRFDLWELSREITDSLEMKALERKITLGFRQKWEKPFWVEGDKDLIRQVIVNLLVNSIKYGRYEGSTWLSFYDMHETVLVEVSDNGIGIEEEHLPRLFERFYRVDKSRSREQGGTGLGLSIVKHILEAHGQSISVRSTVGEGTTFSFTLKKG